MPSELRTIARDVGLPESQVARIQNTPAFADRVLDKVRVRAIYLLADALEAQGQLSKANERAFAALLRVAAGESAGKSVQINNVNAQVTENIAGTAELVRGDRQLRDKAVRSFGKLGLVVVTPAEAVIEEGSASGGS